MQGAAGRLIEPVEGEQLILGLDQLGGDAVHFFVESGQIAKQRRVSLKARPGRRARQPHDAQFAQHAPPATDRRAVRLVSLMAGRPSCHQAAVLPQTDATRTVRKPSGGETIERRTVATGKLSNHRAPPAAWWAFTASRSEG